MAIYYVLIGLLIFGLGVLAGHYGWRFHPNGVIFIGKNEEGDDKIVFQLNMEYDELAEFRSVMFNVVKEKKAL